MMVGRRSKEMVKKKKTEKEKDDEEDKQSFRSFFFIVCRVNYIVITHNCKKKILTRRNFERNMSLYSWYVVFHTVHITKMR